MTAPSPYTAPICAIYDQYEIACMHGERVRIVGKGGQLWEGRAKTMQTRADKTEWLILDGVDDSEPTSIRLDWIEHFEITPSAVANH